MTRLAVAIAAPHTEAALVALHRSAALADLAEVRLDLMQSFDLPALLASPPLPLIITCRPPREGGRWPGSESRRLAVLRQAADLGAAYVDLEWDATAEIKALKSSGSSLILSRHDFNTMPPDLVQQADRLWASGADVVKVVGTAHRLADCLPAVRLLAAARKPTIAIAMGEAGLLTRLAAFRYAHAFLSFGTLAMGPGHKGEGAGERVRGTAAGQIDVQAMRDLFRVRDMRATTALIGLLAPAANGSPLLTEGNAWLTQQGMDARLIPLQPQWNEDPLQALPALAAELPLIGCLVEPPYTAGGRDVLLPGGDGPQIGPAGSLAAQLTWLIQGHAALDSSAPSDPSKGPGS